MFWNELLQSLAWRHLWVYVLATLFMGFWLASALQGRKRLHSLRLHDRRREGVHLRIRFSWAAFLATSFVWLIAAYNIAIP